MPKMESHVLSKTGTSESEPATAMGDASGVAAVCPVAFEIDNEARAMRKPMSETFRQRHHRLEAIREGNGITPRYARLRLVDDAAIIRPHKLLGSRMDQGHPN